MITRVIGTAAVLAALAGTAGCSSAGPAPGRSGGSQVASPPATSASPPASPPVPASASAAGSTPSTPSATATSAPPSTIASTPAVPPVAAAPRSTCRHLAIRVIRGSAAPGYEFAALQFVNTGSTRCVLNGYPTVTLLRAGTTVGLPARAETAASSSFALEPGAAAESKLRDFSSCQAPLSDQIRVVAPGSSFTTTRPGQLRACTLRVSALTTPE